MTELKPDDAALIALIAQARTDALNQLYDRYNRLVFSVALAVIGDRAIAEEATLDVFVQVWRRAGTYRPDQANVRTWLIAITRHHAIDILRMQKSRPEAHMVSWDEVSALDGPVPHGLEERVQLSMQRERVQKMVAELPPDQRDALVLAYFRGYTQSQIAEALNQPLGTIKTRIRLAMQKLRKLLEEDQSVADTSDNEPDA
ncbi:MAG TPA: sigma-70 family RNA polymerase sigma factor [Anaerolineales bacterium]|nr:sigma-70 family RNA polymerase sigma factor [Anaerolineales bacterium]